MSNTFFQGGRKNFQVGEYPLNPPSNGIGISGTYPWAARIPPS